MSEHLADGHDGVETIRQCAGAHRICIKAENSTNLIGCFG